MNFKKTKGFTLIELLVVIAIISLLSSVILATVNDARDKAKITAFTQEVNEFTKALELYRANNNGNLPQGFIYMQNNWISGEEIDGRTGGESLPTAKQAVSPYINKFPKPPFTGGFGYVGDDSGSGSGYTDTCGSSNYFIQVEGSANMKYFDGWTEADGQIYDEDFGERKCYPLN